MSFRATLTKKDFIQVNYVLLYSKLSSKLFTALIGSSLLVSIWLLCFTDKGSVFLVILSLFMFLLVPFMTYYRAVQNFSTGKRSGETIEYEFTPEFLNIRGESFQSQSSWDKLYEVTASKNWVMLWQNRQQAHPIPKKAIPADELALLKTILLRHNVKNNLPV